MIKKYKTAVLGALLLFSPTLIFSQTLNLETLFPYTAFAGVGAITNGGTVTGDAGTNAGIVSGGGFNAVNNNNANTVRSRIDLMRIYIHLDDVFVTHPGTHLPAFGSGETISPGVYSIGGAGSIAGALILDGEGDSDAIFIMKFEGAFTVGAGSSISLINGARASNVFWIAQGAISVATDCVIKGTLFAHPGAVTLGVGSTIQGRLLSSEGAITIAAGCVAEMPDSLITIPIKCSGQDFPNPLLDVLGSIKNYALFTTAGAVANAATSGIIGDIGSNGGAVSGFATSTNIGEFFPTGLTTAQAVLDLNNAYAQIMTIPNTDLAHPPAFGSGETVTAGVYFIAGAGSLAGTVILDAENDPDAMFVFKFAGAFSVAAQSRVILTNGAKQCNVFWIGGAGVPTGAVSVGTFSYMKGTLISHGGACTAGANASVEGRMLSTAGAIGFSTGIVYNDPACELCDEYKIYLTNLPEEGKGTDLYEVIIEGDSASLIQVGDFEEGLHIALGRDGEIYAVANLHGKFSIYDPLTGNSTVPIQITYNGIEVTNTPQAAVDPNTGFLFVASSATNTVYQVNPVNGEAAIYAETEVSGGDLVFDQNGDLWIANRFNGAFLNLSDSGSTFAPGLADITGAARLADGTYIVSSLGSFELNLVDPKTGVLMAKSLGIDIQLGAGDMAAGCISRPDIAELQEAVDADAAKASALAKNIPAVLNTYPNPTKGTSNINFEVMQDGFTSIELIDLDGRTQQVVFSQEAVAGLTYSLQIEATDLPDGIYIYKLTTNKGVVATKLMISKN
ncbi:MAG: hypothetical protein ACJAZC_001264 [Cryomorphaceae bacterium]|jgi:hypothetical protein